MTEIKNAARKGIRHGKRNMLVLPVVTYAVLIVYAIIELFPFAVILTTALSTREFLLQSLGFRVPGFSDVTFDNFVQALTSDIVMVRVNGEYVNSLLLGFANTLWQVIPTVLIGLFVSGIAGYAYAKMDFYGKKFMWAVQTAIIALPLGALVMPAYLYYYTIGWTDSVLPIMIPGMFGNAVTIFYLTQYFRGIPSEVLEAAKLDGLNSFTIYLRIMLPLAVPAFTAQGILMFVSGYNNFMGALLYVTEESQYPLQRALYFINGCYDGFVDAGTICASTLLAMLPLIVVYIIGRNQFKVGIASGAVKG